MTSGVKAFATTLPTKLVDDSTVDEPQDLSVSSAFNGDMADEQCLPMCEVDEMMPLDMRCQQQTTSSNNNFDDDDVDAESATDEQIATAVREVTKVFSKPDEEKRRFAQAVTDVVSGTATIKEASTKYGFATSTLHPYVHKSRHMLGDSAPPMKNQTQKPVATPKCILDAMERENKKKRLAAQASSGTTATTTSDSGVSEPSTTSTMTYGDLINSSKLNSKSGVKSRSASSSNMEGEDTSNQAAGNMDMNSLVAAGMEILSFFDPSVLAAAAAAAAATMAQQNGDEHNNNNSNNHNNNANTSKSNKNNDNSRSSNNNSNNNNNNNNNSNNTNDDWPDMLDSDLSMDGSALVIDDGSNAVQEEKPKYESVEDAAREAIDASKLVDESQSIVMFMAVVKCLNNELNFSQAANNYGLTASVIEQVVHDAEKLMGRAPSKPATNSSSTKKSLPSTMTIEESVRRIITVSHYTGDRQERLFTAVFNTVKGELPLTQASAVYNIPFSTLHPYVKKVRQDLGLVPGGTPGTALRPKASSNNNNSKNKPAFNNNSKFSASQKLLTKAVNMAHNKSTHNGDGSLKRPTNSSSTNEPATKKVKRPSPFQGSGSTNSNAFKPVLIPDNWKQDPKAVELAVTEAVKSCQYEDASKKRRLASAVYEAVLGDKTMKTAATDNNVPFTTLQTYFHRTRVALAKYFGEDPLMLDLPQRCALPLERKASNESNTAAAISHLLVAVNDSNSNDETKSNSSSSGGSSKRKPAKTYKHGVPSPAESPQIKVNPFLDEDYDMTDLMQPAPTATATGKALPNCSITVSDANPSDEWPDMLDDSPVNENSENLDDWMCEDEQPLPVGDDAGSPVGADNEAPDDRPLPAGYTFEMIVHQSIRNTHYTGEAKQAMIDTLIDAVSDKMSLREAARVHNTQVNALHNYFSRARQMCKAMRNGEDPKTVLSMTASEASAQARRIKDVANGLFDGLDTKNMPLQELLDEAVKRVIRTSLYPPEQKDRLRKAVEKVISGELTINAAANMHQLPSSTVHPYVHRARALLGDRCPPQAQGPTPLPPSGSIDSKSIDSSGNGKSSSSRSSIGAALPLPQHDAPSMVPQTSVMPLIGGGESPKTAEDIANALSESDSKLSAKATLRAVRRLGPDYGASSSSSASMERPATTEIDQEQAEATITELVKNSLYDAAGKKRLFEAVLSVVMERSNTSEAARANQVPPSTIQPYVQKTRVALGIPIMGLAPPNSKNRHNQYTVNRSLSNSSPSATTSSTSTNATSKATTANNTSASTITPVRRPNFDQQEYAKPGEEASDDEIRAVVDDVTKTCSLMGDRRVALWNAVHDAVHGLRTIKEASNHYELCGSTVHPYVSKARVRLGSKCPQPKMPVTGQNQFTVRRDREQQQSNTQTAKQSPLSVKTDNPTSNGNTGGSATPSESGSVDRSSSDRRFTNEPIPCTPEELDTPLEKELLSILSRYNFRGDMKKLVRAITWVLGDHRTLLEVSTQTDIAQTTLSTYVRIAKLFLKESFLIEHQASKQQTAVPSTSAEQTTTTATASPQKEEPVASSPVPSPAKHSPKGAITPTNVVLTTAAAELSDYSPYLDGLCAGGSGDVAHERRIKSACTYLVKMQYRRSSEAQQMLIDACEDVLLNGLSAEEAHKCHEGVSLHVLNIYLGRIKQAADLFEQPLNRLHKYTRDLDAKICDPDNESGDTKTPTTSSASPAFSGRTSRSSDKTSSTTPKSSAVSPSPVRVSRRLQQKLEEKKQKAKYEHVFMPHNMQTRFVDYIHKLETANFPVPERFVVGCAQHLMRHNEELVVYAELGEEEWHDWYTNTFTGTRSKRRS